MHLRSGGAYGQGWPVVPIAYSVYANDHQACVFALDGALLSTGDPQSAVSERAASVA